MTVKAVITEIKGNYAECIIINSTCSGSCSSCSKTDKKQKTVKARIPEGISVKKLETVNLEFSGLKALSDAAVLFSIIVLPVFFIFKYAEKNSAVQSMLVTVFAGLTFLLIFFLVSAGNKTLRNIPVIKI